MAEPRSGWNGAKRRAGVTAPLFALTAAAAIVAGAAARWWRWMGTVPLPLSAEAAPPDTHTEAASFRAAFERAPLAMAHVARDGTLRRVNRKLSEMTGYARDELLAMPFDAIVAFPAAGPDTMQALADTADAAGAREGECRTKGGGAFAVSVAAASIGAPPTDPLYSVVIDDIASRRAAEAALQERTAELEALLDTAPVAILFSHERKVERVSVNRLARRLLDFEPKHDSSLADLHALPLRSVRLYRDGVELTSLDALPLRRATAGERVVNDALEARLRDGRVVHLLANASAMRDARGDIVGAVAVYADVTPLKRAEADLRESEERFRATVESVPSIVFVQRADGTCEYVNPRYAELTGRDAQAVPGAAWQRDVHPDDRAAVEAAWREAAREGGEWACRFRLRAASGAFRWALGVARPLRGADGAAWRWLGVVSDVHDLVEAAEQVRQQKERLRLALAAGGLGTWQYDVASDCVTGDDAFCSGFGLEPGAAAPLEALLQAVHARDRRRLAAVFRPPAGDAGNDFDREVRVRAKDGTSRWIGLRGHFDRGRLIGVCADVTARREAAIARAREAHSRIRIDVLTHHIGNLFPVILSIVNLTAEHYADVATYRQALTQRLRALEKTHELLAREHNETALVGELVRSELAAFVEDGRVRIEGPAARLAAGVAESFAMIVHELATNSVKYGALGDAGGTLEVRWRPEPATRGSWIVFEWTEANVPAVVRPPRRGYGSRIIGGAGAPLVGRNARLERTPDGLRYALTLPCAALRAAADAAAGEAAPNGRKAAG